MKDKRGRKRSERGMVREREKERQGTGDEGKE